MELSHMLNQTYGFSFTIESRRDKSDDMLVTTEMGMSWRTASRIAMSFNISYWFWLSETPCGEVYIDIYDLFVLKVPLNHMLCLGFIV